MIRIQRPPAPDFFESDRLRATIAECAEHFEKDYEKREQETYRCPPLWMHPDLKSAVIETFHGKCCYCEQSILATQPVTIEHFRPKTNAMGLDRTLDPDHYWWLAYKWENLYMACQLCNSRKASRFPVEGKRAGRNDLLSSESAILLDPCSDDPDEWFAFESSGIIRPRIPGWRAEVTIDLLSLNRPELVRLRCQMRTDGR
jgi:uncharacterized protein (TIGR02646 family)